MAAFHLYFYRTAAGDPVVEDRLVAITRSERAARKYIIAGLEMVAAAGLHAPPQRLKRLRHIRSGPGLWELRVMTQPAYRLLLAPIPGEQAFIVLDVVRKDAMAKDPRRYIDRALDAYDEWIGRIDRGDG
jgi:hypothetical protein